MLPAIGNRCRTDKLYSTTPLRVGKPGMPPAPLTTDTSVTPGVSPFPDRSQ